MSKSILKALLTLVVISSATEFANAQNRMASQAAATQASRLRPKQLYLVQILVSPDVQNELGVGEEQKTGLEKMRYRLGAKMKDTQQKAFEGRAESSPEKRAEIMRDAQDEVGKIFEESDEMLDELLTPSQMRRLKEIHLQRLGIRALFQTWVREELGIDKSLGLKIDEMYSKGADEIRKEVAELSEKREYEKIRDYIVDENASLDKELLGLLSPIQRKKLENLKGKEFEFSNKQTS